MKRDPQLDYLIDLYDDPDVTVTEMGDAAVRSRGEAVLSELLEIMDDEQDKARKELISDMIAYYNVGFRIEALTSYADLCRKGEASLMEGTYLLSSLMTPGLSRTNFYDAMLPMIGEIMSELSDDKTAVENVTIFNHIFYRRFGFSTTDPFNINEGTSLLVNVIANRVGSPFAMAVVYFTLAQACGLDIYPLCFTGGFVPVYEENGKILFYINVYHEGEIFMETKLKTFLEQQPFPIDEKSFKVRKDASILVMYLEFIQLYYSSKHDTETVEVIEKALKALGSDRFLSVEEEE